MFWNLNQKAGLNPVLYTGCSGFVGNGNGDGPTKQLLRVKAVVNFLVLEESVGVNAGPGDIEISTDERKIIRYFETDTPWRRILQALLWRHN